jgi:hypothetical protein
VPSKAKQTAQLPAELIPVLDIIAEMVADSMVRDMEQQAANRDDAPHRFGKENQQEKANIVIST